MLPHWFFRVIASFLRVQKEPQRRARRLIRCSLAQVKIEWLMPRGPYPPK